MVEETSVLYIFVGLLVIHLALAELSEVTKVLFEKTTRVAHCLLGPHYVVGTLNVHEFNHIVVQMELANVFLQVRNLLQMNGH